MTPTDYLSIARWHWKLIAALVVVAVAVVYRTSPEKAKGTYEATHILEVSVDDGRGGGSDTTPEKVALYTTVDQVAAEAAATLGYDGDPAALANKVEAAYRVGSGPPADLPCTDRVAGRVVSLPIWSDLPLATVDRVAGAIAAVHEHAGELSGRTDREGVACAPS